MPAACLLPRLSPPIPPPHTAATSLSCHFYRNSNHCPHRSVLFLLAF
jgi:hypothetical protein